MTRRTKQPEPPSDPPPVSAGPSFEESLEELEAIVHSMDSDRLPLEELLAKYERGTALLKQCQGNIEAAQQRVELITSGKSGVALAPFSAESAAGASPQKTPSPPPSDTDDEIRLF